MELSPLYSLIKGIEYGTKLHIGIIFLKNYGNELCKLPREQGNHRSPMCNFFKTKNKDSYARCFRCSRFVLHRVIKTKRPIEGTCINGIYEYTYPVILDGEVICVVFIGNILKDRNPSVKSPYDFDDKLLDTLEKDFSKEQCETLCRLIEDYILHLLENSPYNTLPVLSLIENIKNYITSNLEYEININHIADIFHYNPAYLGRLFKKETGVSFNAYVTSKRIAKAKTLLLETNRSCIEISAESGFNNVTYFNLVFKKHTNLTPVEYRQKKGER